MFPPRLVPRQRQRQRGPSLHVPSCRKSESRCGALMGLDWIAEEGLPQGRFGFVASRRFFLPRPLSRGQRPEGKSPGFSESPEIGSCISFTEQQQVLEA